MARFTGGWIKLWRRAVEGDLADNMFLWGLWNWLLYAAHWKPSSIIWKGKRRDIPAGTVVLGMAELAEKWECSRTTIKKWLDYLVDSERIYVETCQRGTLVTIRNWDIYQAPFAEERQPSGSEVAAECQLSGSEVALIEEGKKEEDINAPKPRKERVVGAVENLRGDSEVETLLAEVDQSTQKRWIKLYGDTAWMKSEMVRMVEWLELNPAKRPKKSPARFISSWLSRGWEKHRKGIPTQQAAKINTTPVSLEAL